MSYAIRKATKEDALGIAKAHIETWKIHYRGHIANWYIDSLEIIKASKKWGEAIERTRGGSEEGLFLVEDKGEVLGFCFAGFVRDKDKGFVESTGEVRAIYLHPDHHGKGIGSKLMDEGIRFLKEKGYKKAILWVLTSNISSINFYKHKGWKPNGKEKIQKIGKDKSNQIELHEVCYEIDL